MWFMLLMIVPTYMVRVACCSPIQSSLLEVGLAFIVDHSGRIFTKQAPTLRDVVCNSEVGVA